MLEHTNTQTLCVCVCVVCVCVCVCERERERERGPGHIPDQISETHHQNSQPCWPSSSNSSLAYH